MTNKKILLKVATKNTKNLESIEPEKNYRIISKNIKSSLPKQGKRAIIPLEGKIPNQTPPQTHSRKAR